MGQRPLLVGNESDAHLRTVADLLQQRGVEPVVFDADSLAQVSYSFSPQELIIDGEVIAGEGRAWLRRAAPNRWSSGDRVGSVADVSFRARVRLIAAIARRGNREWVTGIDALLAAEDRVHQLAVASRLGIATPPTIVSSDPAKIELALGRDAVIKPLATGAFVNAAGEPQAVYTAPLTADLLASGDFGAAPFVAQTRIEVRQHLRVVTAGCVVTTATLEADMWPLDWRAAHEAHYSWRRHELPEVEAQAVRLAAEMRVGFSSQDWLVPESGPPIFIDLNPAGQWMFLPHDVADPITEHIVNFLSSQP
ncbi:MAG: hypothetical protein OXD34_12005 [bacterium]|nr:hypothetical protein [bacterium]